MANTGMKDHAYTAIWCPTADPSQSWVAHGASRAIAEHFYSQATLERAARPPLYRVVVQYKVDQHDRPDLITAVN